MWVIVDIIDGLLLAGLATPPVGVEDEEELVVGEVIESRQTLVRSGLLPLFPRSEGGCNTARICNVLTQRQSAVDVQRSVVALDGEVVVLIDKAISPFIEFFDRAVCPPIGEVWRFRSVITLIYEGIFKPEKHIGSLFK